MIGNHNNELNAAAHRRAVEQNFNALKVACDEMKALLEAVIVVFELGIP